MYNLLINVNFRIIIKTTIQIFDFMTLPITVIVLSNKYKFVFSL